MIACHLVFETGSTMNSMSTLGKLPVSLLGRCGDLGIDLRSVIALPESEHSSWWAKLTADAGTVEGKLHLPKGEPNRLLVFEPGFPGGGSTDFEIHHLKKFLDAGYTVFTIRHNGSFLNGLHSDYYISCQARQEKALTEKQQCLGQRRQHTIGDWLFEPFIAVESLGAVFDEIVLAGHSFGGLALFSSIKKLIDTRSEKLSKIKRIVSLAGATGRVRSEEDPILIQWGDYLDTDWARERVDIGEPAENIKELYKAYNAIHGLGGTLPADIELIFVCPWGDTTDSTDEFITPQEALDMIVTLGRGNLIIDKSQKANPDTGALAHDMSKLTTEMFVQFTDPNWIPEKQILRLESDGLH